MMIETIDATHGSGNFKSDKCMSEKMGKLKIKIPGRYLNFIDDYCEITGQDRKSAMLDMVTASMVMFIEDLDQEDRVRLIGKYQLTDIYKIPDWMQREVFQERCEHLRDKCISEGLRSLTIEEKAELGMMGIGLAMCLGKTVTVTEEKKND
jgi:hypothetical protein